MRIVFDLPPQQTPGPDHHLLFEAGPDYCAYAYLNKPRNSVDGLRYLTFDVFSAEESLRQVVSEMPAAESIHRVAFCSAFPQAVLVPNRFFSEGQDYLQHLFADKSGDEHHDRIPEWQLTTVYSFPHFLTALFADRRGATSYFHAYTPSIKVYNGYIADNQLVLNFGAQQFRVLVKKAASVQLAQTYSYKTPLDVVYYLLKICHELGMEQAETHLVLSGLVEKDSALVTEVQQYFQNVHFANPPEMNLPAGKHPQHYFTSLYNLAACVS